MDRKKLFKTLAYIIILFFLVNSIADALHWYTSIWWFDMPMHFLGGFWVGLTLIWLLFSKTSLKNSPLRLSWDLMIKIFFGILLVGILWELFELLVYNAAAQNPFNIFDTISDVLLDLAGGTFAILYFFKKTMPEVSNKVHPAVEL